MSWTPSPTSTPFGVSPAGGEGAASMPENKTSPSAIFAMLARFADVATLLRLSGALTVVAAMSAFLLQDWAGGSDMTRYYLLLSQTGLLAAGGFGLSYLLKENKGARVFLSLALLSITANLATLGALVYSITQWGGALGRYPSYATWQAGDPAMLGLAIGAGVLVLSPVALFGFTVLARCSAKALLPLFLLTNLLMLLPVRESGGAAVVIMLAVLLPLGFLPKLLKQDTGLRTPEGIFALISLFVPALVMLVRDVLYYRPDAILQIALSATAYIALRFTCRDVSKTIGGFAGSVSLLLALMIAKPLAAFVTPFSPLGYYAVFGVVITLLGVDVIRRYPSHQKGFARIVAGLLAISEGMAFLLHPGVPATLLFMVTGGVILAMGKSFQQRRLAFLGVAMLAVGLFHQLSRIVALVDFSNWLVLALLGATAIVAASVIERHGAVIALKWRVFFHRQG